MSKQSALVWKRNNPDKAKANHKAWRDANKQKLAQWDAAYRSTPEGKEKARLRQQKYREENRERVRELERARRAAMDPEARKLANRTRAREYYQRNPERWRAYGRKQRGLPDPTRPCPDVCESCGRSNGKHGMHLDHCHESGKFRGWLCGRCNRGLGFIGDNIESVERLLAYMKRCE
jgi:hypothetical protein